MIEIPINGIEDYRSTIRKLDRANLITTNAVYFFGRKNKPEYIGSSINIAKRLRDQMPLASDLIEQKKFVVLFLKFCETEKIARDQEKIFLYEYKPKHNKVSVRGKTRLHYCVPHRYKCMIDNHYKANRDEYQSADDVIIKAIKQFFGSARQLELC